ncbi:hypothetical protein [Photobacterium swingsii]|uniref:hypothetical protein n=1 Tax=Photobacterium swingsii TaxID=680026 RepID=UPI0040689F06
MKKKLLITVCTVLSLSAQATEPSPTEEPRYDTLRQELVAQDKQLQLRLFTGSGMNYGHELPITTKLNANNDVLDIEFTRVNFNNLSYVKNLLTSPSGDSTTGVSDSTFSKFIYHNFAPTITLIPHELEQHSSTFKANSSLPLIECSLHSITASNDGTVDYSRKEGFKVGFHCPMNIEVNDTNDIVYDISWNVDSNAIYKFMLPSEQTGYRLAITSGTNYFGTTDSDTSALTVRPYLNMSIDDLVVPHIDVGNHSKMVGPNAQLAFYIDPRTYQSREINSVKESIRVVNESLHALGYNPTFTTSNNIGNADVIITKAPLPNAEEHNPSIIGKAAYDSALGKNVITINSGILVFTFDGHTGPNSPNGPYGPLVHEISHVIGLAHQTRFVDSIMGGSGNYLPGLTAPTTNSERNRAYSYVDAQVLKHVEQQLIQKPQTPDEPLNCTINSNLFGV